VKVNFIRKKKKTQVYGVDDAIRAETNINKDEDDKIWNEHKRYKKRKEEVNRNKRKR